MSASQTISGGMGAGTAGSDGDPAPPRTGGFLSFLPVVANGLLLGLLGAALVIGGLRLLQLGGSTYYALAGGALLVAALLYVLRNSWGAWLYFAILAATAVWTVWETGLDPWAWLPRMGLLGLVGLWLLLPFNRNGFRKGPLISVRAARLCVVAALLVCMGLLAAGVSHQAGLSKPRIDDPQFGGIGGTSADADWQAYGATPAGTRFSALNAITPANVGRLEPAWTYSFGEENPNGLQVTPLKVGNTLYACSSSNIVVALDADTGKQRWRFDPRTDIRDAPFRACKGVAYYRVPGADGICAERIYTNTVDALLLAVDARTGKLCPDFGRNGRVSLLAGLGPVTKGYYFNNAAPTIARGRIILGGYVLDNQHVGEPSGVIRAFDAVSGKLSWAYDVGRPDRTGEPPEGETYTPGTPNSWGQMSYDDALGLVYMPTGNATPDYYGGERRPFDEESSTSIMALDVETGRRRWIFQTVHHDLWDYDVGSQPTLVDLTIDGKPVPALLQPTKRGEIFVLDRRTGDPLDPVDERAVPTRGAVPTEPVATTQPYPRNMPSLAGEDLTEAKMWGLTPLDQLYCRIQFRSSRYDGQMTPPGLERTIMYPGMIGGMNWGSASVDPDRGIVIAVTNEMANRAQLITRAEADRLGAKPFAGSTQEGIGELMAIFAQSGLPYAAKALPFLSPLSVPCQQPPWSHLTAIDLNSYSILWSRPLGTAKENGPFGISSRLPITMGVPVMGGVLVTRSGLSFVGGSSDRTFRAFDTATGKLLWQHALPESGNATPMTYSGASGRQFVLIAAGGHKTLGTKNADYLVAFALRRAP